MTTKSLEAKSPEPLLHNYAEARALLGGVPISTFSLWIAQGLLIPVRIGPRRSFIRHSDILALAGVEVTE